MENSCYGGGKKRKGEMFNVGRGKGRTDSSEKKRLSCQARTTSAHRGSSYGGRKDLLETFEPRRRRKRPLLEGTRLGGGPVMSTS